MSGRPLLGARTRRRPGFTLVEVVLAIAIGSGLLVAVLSFYHHASRVRDEVRRMNGTTSSARLLIATLTRELECAIVDHGEHRRFKGWRDSIEYLTTAIPDEGAWSDTAEGSTPYPQTDVRWVRYWIDGERVHYRDPREPGDDDERDREDRRRREANDAADSVPAAVDFGAPSKSRIKRAERELLRAIERDGRRAVTESIAAIDLPIFRFRYFDGRWHDEWHHHHLPHGVEVTAGAVPHEIFRRIIAISAAGDLGAVR